MCHSNFVVFPGSVGQEYISLMQGAQSKRCLQAATRRGPLSFLAQSSDTHRNFVQYEEKNDFSQ